MRVIFFVLMLAMMTWSVFADETSRQPVAGEPPAWEQYQSIVHQNIFIRERTKPRMESSEDDVVEMLPDPSLVLRGIVLRGETYFAFIEDIDFGDIIIAEVNEKLADGEIESISLEALEFKVEDEIRKVFIGQWVDGEGDANGVSSNYTNTAYKKSNNTSDNTEEELSIIERLRRQREAELGKDSTQ